jgi:hypothetical protein
LNCRRVRGFVWSSRRFSSFKLARRRIKELLDG